ncbi:nuclear localization sequence binding protein [Lecanora helva]
MAKTKAAVPGSEPSKSQKSGKGDQVKTLSSVKEGAVTKPSQTSKSKSKEMAKQVATKADKADKKSKKAKKEPTPVSSDESESESEDASGSASSDDESEMETPAPKDADKANGVKTNGTTKASTALRDGGSDSSDSSTSSEDEDAEPKTTSTSGLAAASGAKDESEGESDSDDSASEESDESSEDSSDDEKGVAKNTGPVDARKLNDKLTAEASNEVRNFRVNNEQCANNSYQASSEEDSDDEGGSSGSSDESSSDESTEETKPSPKKRKAEAEAAPMQKKFKADSEVEQSHKKNLFVGQLSYNVDEEWLTREFEQFGELSRVKIMVERETGRSRGFGYVEYVNIEDGEKAHAAMHGKDIDGRTINVDFSKPRGEPGAPRQERQDRSKIYGDTPSAPSDTIFVANLPFEVTQEAVGDAFAKHGEVLGVRLPTDQNSGNPKGFGYVQFGSIDEAKEAFDKMKGAVIMGRPVRLDFSSPRPPRDDSFGGRGGRGGGRGGRGDRGRGRGGFDRGGGRGGRGGSTNRGGFGDFKGQKKTF